MIDTTAPRARAKAGRRKAGTGQAPPRAAGLPPGEGTRTREGRRPLARTVARTVTKVTAGLAMLAGAVVAPPAASPAGADPVAPFPHDDTADISVDDPPAIVDLDGPVGPLPPNDRLWDVVMTSDSIFVPGTNPAPPPGLDTSIDVTTRIYLPDNYDHDREAPYPVLYLLHGGVGSHQDWSTPPGIIAGSCGNLFGVGGGDITNHLDSTPTPFITVLVDGGCAGWYTDWLGETDGNFRPLWETFHTDELIPWVDTNLNTDATSQGRVIAGVSMGGFGATRYAAHRPDLFRTVGSFSGALDLRYEPFQDTVSDSMWSFGASVNLTGLGMTEYRMTPGGDSEQEETARLEALFGVPLNPQDSDDENEGPGDDTDDLPAWPTINPAELATAGAFAPYEGELAVYSGSDESDIEEVANRFEDGLSTGLDYRSCHVTNGAHNYDSWTRYLNDFVGYAFGSTGDDDTCPVVPAS